VLRGLLRARLRRGGLVALVAGCAAASALLRFGAWRWGGITGYHVACASLPARADALLAGALAALTIYHLDAPLSPARRAALRGAAWAAAAILAALLLWCRPGPHLFCGAYAAAGTAAALLIAGITAAPPRLLEAVLSGAALTWVGRISYGLYLWHVPVFCVAPLVFGRLLGRALSGSVPERIVAFGISFALAAASHYLVERPCRRLIANPRASRVLVRAATSCQAA
jgi:peptidoglycan/LPS O-acetylase OafA/YrhL